MVPPALVCLRASLKSFSWRKTRPATSLSVALFPIAGSASHSLRLAMADQGGSKIQEAYLIFQDLSERYQSTSLLLNGKAVCCMHMGNFDEAETLLVEALNKACFACVYIIHFYGFDNTIDIASCLHLSKI